MRNKNDKSGDKVKSSNDIDSFMYDNNDKWYEDDHNNDKGKKILE